MSNAVMWIVIAAAMMIIELVTVQALCSIWFCFSAVLAAITAVFFPDFMLLQISVFIVFGLLFFLGIRKYAIKAHRWYEVPLNTDRIIGKKVKLLTDFDSDGLSAFKSDGVIWTAEKQNETVQAKAGDTVEIVSLHGNKYFVK